MFFHDLQVIQGVLAVDIGVDTNMQCDANSDLSSGKAVPASQFSTIIFAFHELAISQVPKTMLIPDQGSATLPRLMISPDDEPPRPPH